MSDLIKLVGGIDKARSILKCAGRYDKIYDLLIGDYSFNSCPCCIGNEISIEDLQTAIANHDRTDNCVDISNHTSLPNKPHF